jgi:Ca-activated chloride channel family protein
MNAMPPSTPAHILSVRTRKDDEQGFGALLGPSGGLPLTSLSLTASIVGEDAELSLTQCFVNDSDDVLEVTYVFPLPRQAAVVRARAVVGDRVISGDVKERGEARAAYAQARRQGRAAALLEQERGDVFTLTVGSIGPRQSATFELVLAQALLVADDEITFRFPFTIAPRYVPGVPLGGPQAGTGTAADTDVAADASRVTPPVLLPGSPRPVQLSAVVRVRDPERREKVTSSIEAVDTSFADGWWTMALRPGVAPDRDWVVRRQIAADGELQVAPDPGADEGTFTLRLPPVAAAPVDGMDVVIVLDRSGSMGGWAMRCARDAARYLLDGLTPADRVAVLAFDDQLVGLVDDHLADASAAHLTRLREALGLVVPRGGTELKPALAWAAQCLMDAPARQPARERAIIVLTDGAVADDDALVRQVSSLAGDVRVHTVGICAAVNEGLLGRLSEQTAGLCELVESPARMAAIARRLAATLRPPALTGGALSLEGATVLTDSLHPAPGSRGFEAFEGRPLVVRGRYRGPAPSSATFTATRAGAAMRTEVVADVIDSSASRTLWARAHLEALEQRYAATGDEALEVEIVSHAVAHQLPSRLTAWVAMSDDQVIAPGTPVRQQTQPVVAPQGFAAGMLEDAPVLSHRAAKTRTGVLKGRFSFLSPEGVRGQPRQGANDVFVLGLVLYELLTGQRLFKADSSLLVLKAIADVTLPEPLLPASLARYAPPLRRMLARQPQARPTAVELLAELDDLLDDAEGEGLMEAVAPWLQTSREACARYVPPADLSPGELRVGDGIGRGDSSEHFLAWWARERTPTLVAVRRLMAGLAEDPEIAAPFVQVDRQPHPAFREVMAVGPNPDVYGDPGYCRIEEMIWGVGVLELVRGGRPLPPRAALEIARQVAAVLPVFEEGGSANRLVAEALLVDVDARVRLGFHVGMGIGRPGGIEHDIVWPDAQPRPSPLRTSPGRGDPLSFVPIDVSRVALPKRRRLAF